MRMKWKNVRELIEYPKEGILSKKLFKSDRLTATLFCMTAGTEIGQHTSTKEGVVYILEGKGTFNLEGRNISMLPGVLIHMSAHAVHSLKARTNTAFVLLLRG